MEIRRYAEEALEPFYADEEVPLAKIIPIEAAHGRPGEEFNKLHTTSEVMSMLGFSFVHGGHGGDQWVRPGKSAKDGTSATVYPDGGVAIWSDSCLNIWPDLELGKSYDPFGLLVATRYHGDFSFAAKELAAEGYGAQGYEGEDDSLIDDMAVSLALEGVQDYDVLGSTGWEAIDLSIAVTKGPPPQPDIFCRSDGVGLIYRGKINFFYGPPESAKSWAAQKACVDVFLEGGKFVYLDFENTARDVADHFRLLGADPQNRMQLDKNRAIYISPSKGWSPEAKDLLDAWLQIKPDVVVIDGMMGAMSRLQRTPESNTDFAAFEMEFMRPLAACGAALVAIDHTPKSTGNSRPSTFGAQHKKAATTGSMIYFHPIDRPGRGKKGYVRLFIEKDKAGWLRQYATDEEAIGDFKLSPDGDFLSAVLDPAGAPVSSFRPTYWMEQLSYYIEHNNGCTEEALFKAIQPKTGSMDFRSAALNGLQEDGYILINDRGVISSTRPYRATAHERSYFNGEG